MVLYMSFGYPINVAIIKVLGIPSTPFNMGVRVIWLGISVYLIGTLILKETTQKLYVSGYFIILFWILYSMRLFYDVSFRGIYLPGRDSFYTYTFAFGSCFIPSVAIFLCAKHINLKKAAPYLFYIIFASNIAIVLVLKFFLGADHDITMLRANISSEDGGGNVLNPIGISYYGELLALVAIAKLLVIRGNNFFNTLICFLAIIIGLSNLALGASRGPLFSFIIILLFIVATHFKVAKYTPMYIVKFIAIVSSFTALIYFFIFPYVASLNLSMFSRVSKFFIERVEKEELEARDYEWSAAWNQFLNSPFIGDKYLNDYDGFYPHNIALEVLMSTGIVGGIAFMIICSYILQRAFYTYQTGKSYFLFFIAFSGTFFIGLTSGCIWLTSDFWVMITFVLSCRFHKSYG